MLSTSIFDEKEPFLALVKQHGPYILGGGHFPYGMCWCMPGRCPNCLQYHVHRRFADGAAEACDTEGFEDFTGKST